MTYAFTHGELSPFPPSLHPQTRFGPQGWDLGLRLEFGPRGWDLSFKARGGTEEEEEKKEEEKFPLCVKA